jgi:3-polyprenyl-4-hydroxybenzoate decarboxylase
MEGIKMSKSLRDFLEFLHVNHPQELLEVDAPVSLTYEMTALALELESQKRYPALLFRNVKDASGSF